jgi:hypothetical protein
VSSPCIWRDFEVQYFANLIPFSLRTTTLILMKQQDFCP